MEFQETINTMPRIGDTPEFEAVTTTGNIKFSDFAKDKWIVMCEKVDFYLAKKNL